MNISKKIEHAVAEENVRNSVDFMRRTAGDLAVIELLGELREVVLARTLSGTPRN